MSGSLGFEQPGALAGLLAILPLLALDLLRRERERRAIRYLAGGRPGEEEELFRRRRGSSLCYYLFLAAMILALAGPFWGSRRVFSYHRGLDLVLALDLSRSMEVRDVAPLSGAPPIPEGAPVSRLERGAALAVELLRRTGGARVGIALGRGRGILALPLSFDAESPLALLEGLRGQALSGGGTNLEALIDAASGAFDGAFPGLRGIVLISDGEALSGNLGAALERAREGGISLWALGMGTEAGGAVPQEEAPGEPLRDGEGRPVLSFRQDGVLQEAALLTGGAYLDGNRDDAAALLAGHLRSLSPGTGLGASRREPGSRRHLCVIAGLGFWVLSRCFALRRRRGGTR
jgi:Ca-activated chloride channel family protein